MTAPAVTIHPDATMVSAADVMNLHHVRRLPVVDTDGQLLGVVKAPITAAVRGGIVTLAGQLDAASSRARLAEVVDLTWDIDGVIDIIDHTADASAPAPG